MRLAGENDFESMDQVMRPVPVDSEVIIRTGGGGGWGDPFEREPEAVLGDVREGLVSVEKARADYGVAVDAQATRVDEAATRALRAARA